MLLLSFTHTHMTITVTLALLFIPKVLTRRLTPSQATCFLCFTFIWAFLQFLYVSKPGREEIAAEVYEDEVDLRRSGSYLNSSFRSVWSEPSVDPEDFRVNSLLSSERCYHFALGNQVEKVDEFQKDPFK